MLTLYMPTVYMQAYACLLVMRNMAKGKLLYLLNIYPLWQRQIRNSELIRNNY